MSTLTWADAISRVAGAVSLKGQGDARQAAKAALTETLQDWHVRHDWKFTQVIATDVAITNGSSDFALPTTFKKPYVAYTTNTQPALQYIEAANWFRAAQGYGLTGGPWLYTIYNGDDTGLGQIYPQPTADGLLQFLYYREGIYTPTDDNDLLDIPKRWEVYILDGARARMTLGKESRKSDSYFALYEAGIKKAKEDDRRLPDQFLTFMAQQEWDSSYFFNPNRATEHFTSW